MWFEVKYSVCYDVISEPFSLKKEAVKDSKLGFGDLLSSFSSKVFAS